MNIKPRVLVVWLCAAAMIAGMIASGFYITSGPVAWFLTLMIFVFMNAAKPAPAAPKASVAGEFDTGQGKAKRGDEDFAPMMDLLDDDDVEDLRQRIKQRLVDQIETGNLEDIESFEELLASRDDRLKRKQS